MLFHVTYFVAWPSGYKETKYLVTSYYQETRILSFWRQSEPWIEEIHFLPMKGLGWPENVLSRHSFQDICLGPSQNNINILKKRWWSCVDISIPIDYACIRFSWKTNLLHPASMCGRIAVCGNWENMQLDFHLVTISRAACTRHKTQIAMWGNRTTEHERGSGIKIHFFDQSKEGVGGTLVQWIQYYWHRKLETMLLTTVRGRRG